MTYNRRERRIREYCTNSRITSDYLAVSSCIQLLIHLVQFIYAYNARHNSWHACHVSQVTETCDLARVCSCAEHSGLHWIAVTIGGQKLQPRQPRPHQVTGKDGLHGLRGVLLGRFVIRKDLRRLWWHLPWQYQA